MKNIIEKLQNKPERVKHMIMWVGIVFIMAVIFTFWILTFPSQISNTTNDGISTNLKRELPTAFKSLKFQLNELFKLFK